MHAANSSIFLPVFFAQSWIPEAAKVRLLEWKVRLDLAVYAGTRAPELRRQDIASYIPKVQTGTNQWLGVIDRAIRLEDDGHVAKFIRTTAYGEKICAAYQNKEGFPIDGDMWIRVAQMCKLIFIPITRIILTVCSRYRLGGGPRKPKMGTRCRIRRSMEESGTAQGILNVNKRSG